MKICAECHSEIKETYYSYMDNFLQVKYFEEQDGSDNVFCSAACAGQALMLESFEIKEADEEDSDEQCQMREL